MKIKYTFLAFFLVLLNQLACGQNPIWAIPNNSSSSTYLYGGNPLPFPTIDPITNQPYIDVIGVDAGYVPDMVDHLGAANAVSGPDGNLLFFIIGDNIFDKHGRTIFSDYYNFSNSNLGTGYSEILVVPNPANCNQYYLFTEMADGGTFNYPDQVNMTAAYAILDISVPNSATNDFNPNAMGTLVSPFQDILNLTDYEKVSVGNGAPDISMAATNIVGDNERFVFIIQWIDNTGGDFGSQDQIQLLLWFKLSDSGIQTNGAQPLGLLTNATNNTFGRQELEVVSVFGGFKLATGTSDEIIVFNMDYNTTTENAVFNPFSVKKGTIGSAAYPAFVHGIEMTSDGKYVYFTHTPSPGIKPNIIDCFHPASETFLTLPWANFITTNFDQFEYSYIEKGLDGNLYLTDNNYLAQISNISFPSSSIFDPDFQPINYSENYWSFVESSDYNKRYTLPDQIDGMDYSSHFNNSPSCCIYAKPYNADSYIADVDWNGSMTQTWNSSDNPLNNGTGTDAYITGELVIPAGMQITISDMQLYFHPDAKIIVERSDDPNVNNGAKLILNNCVLTADNRCGDFFMWEGIEVQGYINKSQMPILDSKQGYVRLNNSTVSNAKVGIQAWSETANNRGGIIRCANSSFINNHIDVRIYNYSNFDPITLNSLENQSTFTNCEFRTTGPLNDVNYQPFVHAMLYQCGGVTFRGCDFINEDLNYYDELHRGMGILSIKNKLTVIPACSLPSFPCISPDDPNQFSNLTYGIYSVAGLSLVGFESNGNNFINNRTGIYVGGIVGSKIINNHFEVLRSDFSNIITNQTSGVYLNGCTKYKVEGNSFSDFDDPMVPDGNTRGIVVNNSGENYNEIYRNTFDDLTVGGQSQKINANNFIPGVTFEMKPKGLEWKCNNFSTNIEVDLYVSSGRINFYQGYDLPVSDPNIQFAGARNVFNQEPGDYEIVTESLVNMFLYTHYYDIPTIPINTLGNSFNVQIPTAFNYTQSCPNKIVALYGTSVLYGKKDQLKNEIQELENLVDGGNTSELIQAINSESNGSVKNLLLSNSPYLSDEVLLAYLASNPPAGHMFQVFSANSPLSDLVMQELNATNYPNGVIQNIVSLQNGISDMEYLTYEINYLNSERSEVIDELIRYYMYDTLIVDPMDSIINILVEEDDLERKEELCDAYIIKGDLSNATIIRNQIITEFGSSNYTDLAEININTRFLDDPIASANADSVMHSTLTSIANDPIDKRICPRGEGMLYEHIYSQVIIHDIEDLILPGMAPKSMQTNEGNNQKIQQISIYPNPTSGYVYLDMNDQFFEEELIVEVYDLVGKKLLNIYLPAEQSLFKIDLNSVPTGIYFVHVKNNETTIQFSKLVIE